MSNQSVAADRFLHARHWVIFTFVVEAIESRQAGRVRQHFANAGLSPFSFVRQNGGGNSVFNWWGPVNPMLLRLGKRRGGEKSRILGAAEYLKKKKKQTHRASRHTP